MKKEQLFAQKRSLFVQTDRFLYERAIFVQKVRLCTKRIVFSTRFAFAQNDCFLILQKGRFCIRRFVLSKGSLLYEKVVLVQKARLYTKRIVFRPFIPSGALALFACFPIALRPNLLDRLVSRCPAF